MRILSDIVKQVVKPESVGSAKVIEVREGRALLETTLGRFWAKSALNATVGSWVTYAKTKSGYQVLSLARAPAATTKIVRV